MKNHRFALLSVLVLLTFFAGCADPDVAILTEDPPEKKHKGLKTTSDIGEFDPNADREVVDDKVRVSNPITGPLEAYEPLKQQVAGLAITQAVQIFNAVEGRYPKDHDEFMAKVIKQNNIRLPALGPGKEYQYDVENHQLIVVRAAEPKK